MTVVGPVVEPAPSSVTIAVGATSAAAVLTVEDDDEVKDLGDVTVQLVRRTAQAFGRSSLGNHAPARCRGVSRFGTLRGHRLSSSKLRR